MFERKGRDKDKACRCRYLQINYLKANLVSAVKFYSGFYTQHVIINQLIIDTNLSYLKRFDYRFSASGDEPLLSTAVN